MRTAILAIAVIFLVGCGGTTQDPVEARAPQAPQSTSTRVLGNGVYTDTDAQDTPAQVYRLYRAAFGRVSDAGGLGFHVGGIEALGQTLTDISTNFIASPEFASRYGQLSSEQFVAQLYANVLQRAPDSDGLAFHVGNIAAGRATRAQTLIGFSESPENKLQTSAAIAAGITFVPYPPSASRDCLASPTPDAYGGINFTLVHPNGIQPYACQTVSSPVFDGAESLRVELRPGDCSGNSGFDDCANDRSRMELGELAAPPIAGRIVTYETRLYIPAQPALRPRGANMLFLSQVNFAAPGVFGTLAYLEMLEDGSLAIRTHRGFTFDVPTIHPALQNPTGQWISYRVEVKVASDASGFIKAYVNDRLIVDEARATLPSPGASLNFRVGLYNSSKRFALGPYETQVVYYDAIKRTER
jgi:hypothetical protein